MAAPSEIRSGRKRLKTRIGRNRPIFGADSLQALLLTLAMADFELDWLRRDVLKARIAGWQRSRPQPTASGLALMPKKPTRR